MSTALVGVGHWGSKHAQVLLDDLAVICDTSQAALDRLDKQLQSVPKILNIDELWNFKSVKRVVIVAPLDSHYALVKKALNHKLDVFVEKPFVKTSSEAKELYELAEKEQLVLMVGHLTNYHPIVPMFVDLIKSQKYGYLRKIECRRIGGAFVSRPGHDSDVMWNLGVHDVSLGMNLMRHGMFELDEGSVEALHSTTIGVLCDAIITKASFNCPKGKTAIIEIHVALFGQKEHILNLIFDNAVVTWDNDTQLKLFDISNNPDGTVQLVKREIDNPCMSTPKLLDLELDQFRECCESRTKPITDGREGFKVIRFLQLVSAYIESKKSEKITNKIKNNLVHLDNSFIHSTCVINQDVAIGKGTKIWHFCHISDNCRIGENSTNGQNCFFGVGAKVGSNCKIQNNVSVYAGVECEAEVFLGPSMVFTSVKTPRATISSPFERTLVKKGATIGANATIVCGVTLGEYCMIGAGAVVTKNVDPYALVYGNPAKQRGWVDKDCNIMVESPACKESMDIPIFTGEEEWKMINKDVRKRIEQVLEHHKFIKGPEVSELEKKLAEYVQIQHCIAVGNGTDALQIALMASNVGHGDEVITPAFTFISTAEVVSIVGAVPVFLDILEGTHNVDPAAVEKAVSSKTKALIAASLFGEVAPLLEIKDVLVKLGRSDITLIEDAAQSFGAERYGQRSCSIADISCTSFFPTKPLGCFDDGGAVFTANEDTATKIRQIANHGRPHTDVHVCVGMNSRLDSLQAAVLLSKIEILSESLSSRRKVAQLYHSHLKPNRHMVLPVLSDTCVYAQFTLQSSSQSIRDFIKCQLSKAGIQSRIYWPTPVHLQPVYKHSQCVVTSCSVAEHTCNTTLSLPIYPFMQEADVVRVAEAMNDLLEDLVNHTQL